MAILIVSTRTRYKPLGIPREFTQLAGEWDKEMSNSTHARTQVMGFVVI